MKTKLLTTITVLLTIISFSQSFTVANVNYNITNTTTNEVEVTGSSLTDITVPATVENSGVTYTVTAIAYEAFRSKTNLNSIILGENIVSIGDGAFRSSTIALVTSNATVPPILGGNLVFAETNDIDKRLIIPEGTEEAYEVAGWTSNFEIVNDKFVVGARFRVANVSYEVTSSETVSVTFAVGTDIIIPEDVTYLGAIANVTRIGNEAFENNSTINTIALGENIESVGFEAFRNSTITSIISNATIAPTLGGNVFGSTGEKTLIIPTGATQSYIDAGWDVYFSSIEEVETLSTEEFNNELDEITAYPNPMLNELYLSGKTENIQAIKIFNVNGALVKELSSSSLTNTIAVDYLSSGIYFLKLVGEQSSTTIKVIKQ